MPNSPIRIPIRNDADIAWSLLEVRKITESLGFPERHSQMIATATSELAHNITKYASRGEILIRPITHGRRVGIEIIARDRGPGIADIELAMTDHFSSSGTLGLGLPGVKRMMDGFDLKSESGKGTTVTVLKWL